LHVQGSSGPVTLKRQKDASRLATADAQECIPTADTPTRRPVSSPRRPADTPTRRAVSSPPPTRRHADTPTRFFTPPTRRPADPFLHPSLRSIDRTDQLAKPLSLRLATIVEEAKKLKLIDQISSVFSESLGNLF
jgi:hypothetical protein